MDAVSQWQVEAAVEGISEAFLLPVLQLVIAQFPFVIKGFHSDNGSEGIFGRVAKLLEKLRIEQTKSRSRHSNDNALAESKNNSVVRKHMGYSHIPRHFARPINVFYQNTFNPWLNLHRPCLFPVSITNVKGKVVKRYPPKNVMTPLEALGVLAALGRVKFKARQSLSALQKISLQQTDLQATEAMQREKLSLFAPSRIRRQLTLLIDTLINPDQLKQPRPSTTPLQAHTWIGKYYSASVSSRDAGCGSARNDAIRLKIA